MSALATELLALPERQGRRLALVALLGSVALHGVLALLVLRPSRPSAPTNERTLVELTIVEPPKPPPPEEAPKPEPAPRPRRVAKLEPPPVPTPEPPAKTPEEAPPPPNQTAPANTPPAPIRIGITMSSTSSGGGFAASVGNTLYGSLPSTATDPSEVKPYWASKYVPPHLVTELPVVLHEEKATYPPQARKEGIEGSVVFLLTIDDQGNVAKAKIVKSAGNGLDEAALAAVKRFKFKPARRGGEPVATELRYTYTFVLD